MPKKSVAKPVVAAPNLEPLARDVDLLGRALGAVLREQEGKRFFALEEDVRELTKNLRKNSTKADSDKLEALVHGLEVHDAEALVRAFSHYFYLVNLAEERHRVRRRSSPVSEIKGSSQAVPEPRRQSLHDAVRNLKTRGWTASKILELIRSLELGLTFTAHPTEMRRRTVRAHLEAVASELPNLENDLTQDAALERIAARVEALWGTLELHARNPTVRDEVSGGLAYLGNIVQALPALEQDLREAIQFEFGEKSLEGVNMPPLPLKFLSWIGGDRDGNPNVTPQVTRETFEFHSERARAELQVALRQLFAQLSEHRARVNASQEFGAGHLEPWRYEVETIVRDLHDPKAVNPLPVLERVVRELERAGQHRAAKVFARPVLSRARAFGTHLLSLDVREFSGKLEIAVAQMLAQSGATDQYSSLPEMERVALLERELATNRPLLNPFQPRPEDIAWALEPLEAIREARERTGTDAFGHYVISHAESASDVLEVLILAREAGVKEIDVSPLFETLEDLEAAPAVMELLLSNRVYRAHLGDRIQEIMIGYSDSNKEAGFLAANWALYTAQEALTVVLERHGVLHRFFHGRGTSIGRGGGPAARGILAQPSGTIGRGLRLTEQGEALADRYANPQLAKRNLEQLVYALVLAAAEPMREWPQHYRDALEAAANAARAAYESFVFDPGFITFFEAATPINEISSLRIASRPVRRPGKPSLENLRAIPWVMSWTQTRANLPGWYGLGAGLEVIETRAPGLAAEMYREWPFFRSLLDNAQMSLAKSDMGLFQRYASLAEDRTLAERLVHEFEKTVQLVTAATGTALLETEPVLKRSIDLRNPYVDPIHHVQVELLRRYRSRPADHPDRPNLERALMLSIQGIAAGLRNTG